jgi:hypothetical protein
MNGHDEYRVVEHCYSHERVPDSDTFFLVSLEETFQATRNLRPRKKEIIADDLQ